MSCGLSSMIIVMARRVCSSLACLTSLTPQEQATRLNDKVVSANPSWFRAPRKIDTYFSLLRCSLKCDIINCTSSPFSSSFFFLLPSFGDLRWWVTGVTEQGSLCQWSSSECLWCRGFSPADGKKNDWHSLSHSQSWKTEHWKMCEGGSPSSLKDFSRFAILGPCAPHCPRPPPFNCLFFPISIV